MKYPLPNGRIINIPDKDIEKLEKKLGVSRDEAINTWLFDEEYITDKDAEELTAKAKKNRVTATIHGAKEEKTEKKPKKPREKKENPLKRQIIDAIFAGLSENLPENVEINITNDEKYIDFVIDGMEFTVNLVQHRAKKST